MIKMAKAFVIVGLIFMAAASIFYIAPALASMNGDCNRDCSCDCGYDCTCSCNCVCDCDGEGLQLRQRSRSGLHCLPL